jgi:hypothetical protein
MPAARRFYGHHEKMALFMFAGLLSEKGDEDGEAAKETGTQASRGALV